LPNFRGATGSLFFGASGKVINPETSLIAAADLDARPRFDTGKLKGYEWRVAGIQKAVASIDRGEGVPHERVKEWVSSLWLPAN
jgi:hypothetical protein